ncbi:MAG: YncE family protein [Bryobacteraceae bacterium]
MKARWLLVSLAAFLCAQEGAKKGNRPPRPPRPGVKEVQKPMDVVRPTAVFPVPGVPDWTTASPDGVWVSNKPRGTISRLDAKTNTVTATVEVGKQPCSGIAYGFGSVWAPTCGDKSVARVDARTNTLIATIPVGPANTEGGIACSKDAVWLATGEDGSKVVRIDPKKNAVTAEVAVAAGSHTVDFGEGAVWVTQSGGNLLTRIDAKKNVVTDRIEVGPGPRFLTVGEGFVWTLNQGDGTVSKIDPKTRKVTATIPAGIPGGGGEISAGGGKVWVTVFQIPITVIDAATNKVTHQYAGPGGDAILFAHGSVWLSNLREQNLWRLDPAALTPAP